MVVYVSGGVGTTTQVASWKQSSWNTILNNLVGSCVDIFERNTWETWESLFGLISKEIKSFKKNG